MGKSVEPPTPEEIREACLNLQESWSDKEQMRRAGYENGEMPCWLPPRVMSGSIFRTK